MPEAPNYNQNKTELFRLICFLILACIVFFLMYISGKAPVKTFELADSDCYMRLVRVSELYHSGEWYDTVISRSNAPYGERLHWTRPFDVLLLAGAVPLSLLTNFESALFWWGVIISPVLMIAAIVALQWTSRVVLKADGPFLIGLVFIFQMIIFTYFQPGRPDHHSLIILLFILSLGFAFRMILRPFSAFTCYMAGAVGALAIWVSVESMLSIFIIIAALGVLWIIKKGDFAGKSLYYNLTLFVFTAISLFLERPWNDLTTQQFDRLSIIHLSILGFTSVFWIAGSIFDRYKDFFEGALHRVLFALTGTAVIALMTFLWFPDFYHGPFADVDPRIIPIWLSKVAEVQPLFSESVALTIPVQLIISFVLSISFLFYLKLGKRCKENRDVWIFIFFAALIFFLISLYQVRWAAYTQILLLIPMTVLMVILREMGSRAGFLRTLKNAFILFVFCMGFLIIGLLADVIFKKSGSEKNREEVSLIRMCKYLNETEKWQQRNYHILTDIHFGAEILYRTQHEVIGTPYHRNGQGILDTYEIMTAETDEKALEIIQKRGVDLILLCPKSSESVVYSKMEQIFTFYQRLLENKIPNWLRMVELPSELSSSFLLFEILEEKQLVYANTE